MAPLEMRTSRVLQAMPADTQAAEWRGIKIGAGFVAVVWALVYLL